jgi:hypothetical protein
MALELTAIAVIVLWVLWRLRSGFMEGLCLSVSLLVFLPTYLRITLPQPLPAMTIHRMILILLFIFWFKDRNLSSGNSAPILKKAFIFYVIAEFLSLVFTNISFITSLKDFLDHAFEIVVFYFMISSVVRDGPNAIRLLKAVWIGLIFVAIFAVIERYTGFNPVDRYITGYDREKGYGDTVSTMPQRIILGTAMAMGWPLGYLISKFKEGESKLVRGLLWLSAPLFLSCCYFAMSRGPWLAAVMVGVTLVLFGTKMIRRKMVILMALVCLVLVARPGVLGTFTGKAEQTVDTDSQKGGTFRYRLELWLIAWDQVTQSPLRTLVGFGLGAGREIELNWTLSYRGKAYVIDSWDNHFAYALYQSGLLGMVAVMLLHCGAGIILFRFWRDSEEPVRTILACCMGTLVAMVFMMTNVLIFAKQLNFAFWSVFVAGVACAGYYGPNLLEPEESDQLVAIEPDEDDAMVPAEGVESVEEPVSTTNSKPR